MKITYYRVELATLAPVAVTAPQTLDFARTITARTGRQGANPDNINLPIFRDVSGHPAIPATTIAGSLRAALPEPLRASLMGTTAGAATPSRVNVLGGQVVTAGPDPVSITRRTAIDRRRGAARTHTYHDGEVLAAGATIIVRLAATDLAVEQEASVDEVLGAWAPRLGRGVSAGAGRTRLRTIGKGTLDLSRTDDLLAYLNSGGPALVDQVATSRVRVAAAEPDPVISEAFQILDGLHIGAGQADGNKLLITRQPDGTPVVPGSSLKGVLRARCEYILRSVGVPACRDGNCGECPTCVLFGHTLPAQAEDGRLGARGLVAVRPAPISDAHTTDRPHVAVDRVTGGVLDRALYEVELVDQGQFTITVDPLGELPTWATGLLLAALADIDDGYVGIGGGVTRGQGTVRAVAGPVGARHADNITAALAALRTPPDREALE